MDGKKQDDLVEVPIRCKDAYGGHDANKTFTDDLVHAPEASRFIGAELDMDNDKGEPLHFRAT